MPKKIKYCPRRIKWAIGTEVSCGQRMTKKPKIQTQDAMDADSIAQSLKDISAASRSCLPGKSRRRVKKGWMPAEWCPNAHLRRTPIELLLNVTVYCVSRPWAKRCLGSLLLFKIILSPIIETFRQQSIPLHHFHIHHHG